jgi:hypothetical protein
MSIRVADILPKPGLQFLALCYRFVAVGWQHANRENIPDQGFERRCRECCVTGLGSEWTVSQPREMQLGAGLDTASGIGHEVDIIARHAELIAPVEMKNRASSPPEKSDVITFFAKLIDYLCANPSLLQQEFCPVFITTTAFDVNGLGACVGLGIHPVAPGLRPLPVLVHNARLMQNELDRGLVLGHAIKGRFDDFGARINSLAVALSPTWFSQRFGNISETRISVAARPELQTAALGAELQQLSGECTYLLFEFTQLKAGGQQ